MKTRLLTILNILTVSLLSSCARTSEESGNAGFKPLLDTNTKCSLLVVGDYSNFPALSAEADRFKEYYPNVEINYEKVNDYNNLIQTVLEREENKPNIFFSYTSMIGNEKYNEVVSYMEELSNKDLKLDLDCLRPELINKDSDGKILMLPIFSRTYGTFVNNDLFEKEGLSVPTKFSELLTTCAALKTKGYTSPMMGFSKTSANCLMNTVAYPIFLAELANNPEALALANNKDPRAGEYTRKALEVVKTLADNGCFDLEKCNELKNDYDAVINRFLQGDVPMMICAADTPSGTKNEKYHPQSFKDNPFNYTFCPIPVTEEGGYYVDTPSREFSVNKNCENLDMTNEFMRFLFTNEELDNLAAIKGLLSPTKTASYTVNKMYTPFGNVPANRTYFPEALGAKEDLAKQIRAAAYKVGKGEMSVDDAVNNYGSFTD